MEGQLNIVPPAGEVDFVLTFFNSWEGLGCAGGVYAWLGTKMASGSMTKIRVFKSVGNGSAG